MLLKIAHSEVSNSSVQIWVLWIFSEVSRSKDFSLLRALRSIHLLEKKMWNILEIFIVDNSIRSDDTKWEWWQCQFPIIITKLLIGSRYKFQYCLCINIYIFSSMSQNIWSKVTETLQSSSEWVEHFTLCLCHSKFNKYRVKFKVKLNVKATFSWLELDSTLSNSLLKLRNWFFYYLNQLGTAEWSNSNFKSFGIVLWTWIVTKNVWAIIQLKWVC